MVFPVAKNKLLIYVTVMKKIKSNIFIPAKLN